MHYEPFQFNLPFRLGGVIESNIQKPTNGNGSMKMSLNLTHYDNWNEVSCHHESNVVNLVNDRLSWVSIRPVDITDVTPWCQLQLGEHDGGQTDDGRHEAHHQN